MAIQTQNTTIINVTQQEYAECEANSQEFIKIDVGNFTVHLQDEENTELSTVPDQSIKTFEEDQKIVIPEERVESCHRKTRKKTKSPAKTKRKSISTKKDDVDNLFVCHICARRFGCRDILVNHLTTHQPHAHEDQLEQGKTEATIDVQESSTTTVEELTSYEYDYELTFDDSDDDEMSDDEDQSIGTKKDDEMKSIVDFSEFPEKIIEDSKMIVKGKELMTLISRFYRVNCEICEGAKEFLNIAALCRHYASEHKIKGYVSCCGTKLVKPRAMAMHMARHIQPEAFRCNICAKMMTCPKILQYHIQNHLPEAKRPLACPACPRRFSYSSALIAHTISHQAESERPAHICDECGKTFSSPGRLSTHINVVHTKHENLFVCHICARQFSCRGNLVYHLTTHQPRMHQVQCEQCGKWLKNKLCLRKHMVQHSSIRFTCQLCPYTAVNRQCLRNHAKVQHTDDKPFRCDVCGKDFKLKTTLVNHMVQHTGLRKFSCQFCSRTFASSGNYYSHRKRMHPQELANFKQLQEAEETELRRKAMGKK